jgi:hypothetical protein
MKSPFLSSAASSMFRRSCFANEGIMQTGIQSLRAGLVVLAILGIGGVGSAPAADRKDETGTITGKVTFRGKPLPGGTIAFHPSRGKPLVGKIRPDGTYTVKDVPVGKVRVTVETESVRPKPKVPSSIPPGSGEPIPKRGKEPKYARIPDKYAKPETSGLTCDVRGGNQTLDLALE